MSDYFDELEHGLRDAVRRRAHLPWYARLRQLSLRHPGLAVLFAALVVATPTVGAVGAVSGWFGQGKPDIYYPASATSGLGKVLTNGDRLLPIRVADPDGGPPWGIRLVHTTRGATCIQVGRVENGQIGALGIDGAWGNDHEFHEIKPNDQLADICGATDAAGHGFVNDDAHSAPASVDVPLYNSGGAPGRCRSPFADPLPGPLLNGRKTAPALKRALKRAEQRRSRDSVCPAGAMRMVFVGLLGPDAKSITLLTPSGKTETERTAGGVGAYLVVFRETESNCTDFTRTPLMGGGNRLMGGGNNCGSGGQGDGGDLQGPTAVTSVTYDNGKTCSDLPSPSFAAAYGKFTAQSRNEKHETAKQARARLDTFLAAHDLTRRTWIDAVIPSCAPVGWVAPKGPKITAAQIKSPLKVTVVQAKRYCNDGPPSEAYKGKTIVCDDSIPKGYLVLSYLTPATPWVEVSFVARQAVRTSNSWYEWQINSPGNGGGQGSRIQTNVRRGQRISFNTFLQNWKPGVYHGTVSFVQNAGRNGPEGPSLPRFDGSIVVGRFSFKVPLHH
jgi:hypothetical protein